MDQIKIGKFIAECRKKVGLTQLDLADKLGITDRAVSKWENGRAMPDSSLMIDLCKILKINVNDLLMGEVVSVENYNESYEEIILQLKKEKEYADRRFLALEVVLGIVSVLILLIPIIIGAYVEIEDWKRILICFSGFIPCILGFYFCLKIEQVAGYYECKECGHKYVPTFSAISFAMHLGRTRYLKCPKCGKRSWSKKVITK